MIPVLKVKDNDGNVQTISIVAAPSMLAPHAESHGKSGADPITPDDIGAAAKIHSHTAADVGASSVGHTHTAEDVGAAPKKHTHTVDEVSGVANLSNEHMWARSRYVEVLGAEASGTLLLGGYAVTEYLVSDTISVNPHTGEISLVNAETVLQPNLNGKVQGKYAVCAAFVVNGVVDKWQVDNNKVVLKIPADATLIVRYGSGGNNSWDIDKYHTINTAIEVVGYVNASEENAYPVDDEYLYTYMGRVGGKTGFDVLSDTDVLNVLLGVTE